MPATAAKNSSDSVLSTVALYLGLSLFLASFFLPAVGNLAGFDCAWFAMISWKPDEQISRLALFGGWLNLQVLLLFFLSRLRMALRLRALLTVTILFSIPMTWFAIHRMGEARMDMDLKIGHFLWIFGILLIVFPNLPSAYSIQFGRWLGAAAAAIVALMSVPLLIARTMHHPSDMDDFYYVVAWTFGEPAVCAKIDGNAIGREDQRDSTDLTYMQSDCYRNVAAMVHAPQLCKNVKSAGADRLVGSLVAKYNCRRQKYTVGSALPGTGPNFVGAMRSVGFGDDELAEFMYQNRPDIYLDPILKTLRTDPAFLLRLRASTSYDERYTPENKRDAHALEFLDEMVGIQWDIVSLCQKISLNAQARDLNGYSGSLRSACYSYIAFNRRDGSLCRELPSASNLLQANQGAFREGCMKHVAFLRNPAANLQWGRYGPGYFPTWGKFREAIQDVGFPATTPWLQLPRPTSEQYAYHLSYLAWPEHRSAREEFVRRVLGFHNEH